MPDQPHDVLVEINDSLARVQTFSTAAYDWIETHVTLEQTQIWNGNVLEVACHYIGDLITGMLADGLKVTTGRGQTIAPCSQ
jgi:hypothetical protein